ncbi:MAG: hypothetical protein ACK58L_23090 [Planctomycetota bacterium]
MYSRFLLVANGSAAVSLYDLDVFGADMVVPQAAVKADIPIRFVEGSFRDRSARVAEIDGKIVRFLSKAADENWSVFTQSHFWTHAAKQQWLIATKRRPDLHDAALAAGFASALEHERVPTLSWPWEWSFSMLKDVALAQLQLMQAALRENLILKDATPFNFQFVCLRPVLIDVSSIEPWKAGDAWHGYRQFCQTFLFPLMLQSWKFIDFQPWLRGRLDGITPREMSAMLSWRDMLRPGSWTHVCLHALLQNTSREQAVSASLKKHGFQREMIERNVDRLLVTVGRLEWKPSRSDWSRYATDSPHVLQDRAAKESMVRAVCGEIRPHTVWDLGCNRGDYSRIAAEYAEHVLALDADHLTVDQLYRELRGQHESRILPLVYNMADPSPSLGWRLSERRSLADRSRPQVILCLALIHHLVIGSQLLLSDVMQWLAEHRCDVVLEWVDRCDPLVQQLLRNREDIFVDYCESELRNSVAKHFEVRREERLPSGHRMLLHLEPRR